VDRLKTLIGVVGEQPDPARGGDDGGGDDVTLLVVMTVLLLLLMMMMMMMMMIMMITVIMVIPSNVTDALLAPPPGAGAGTGVPICVTVFLLDVGVLRDTPGVDFTLFLLDLAVAAGWVVAIHVLPTDRTGYAPWSSNKVTPWLGPVHRLLKQRTDQGRRISRGVGRSARAGVSPRCT
jgi:hypothetical protein